MSNSENTSLRFGIPSLDNLFGATSLRNQSRGIALNSAEEPAIVAMIGPVGCGKSLLALHLASRYLADHLSSRDMKAVYLSTDLTFDRANKTWRSFRLDYPNLREIPFSDDREPGAPKQEVDRKIDFAALDPLAAISGEARGQMRPLSEYLRKQSFAYINKETRKHPPLLGFVDLISKPVGDAWGFANRVLGALSTPKAQEPRHLVIVDTVEGFESIVGDRDATGQESSLRARMERLIHVSRGKCHLVFVVEDRGVDHPLTHIADVLIRIRAEQDRKDDYRVRTLEVEKARGQAIERGKHHLLIRTGRGSTTGEKENPDDPRTANAYIMVVPSLHAIHRRFMNQNVGGAEAEPAAKRETRAGFGIPFLDEMLGGDITEESRVKQGNNKGDRKWSDLIGLQHGTVAAILGDANTQKTKIGLQFLLRGFELFAESLADKVVPRPNRNCQEGDLPPFWAALRQANWDHGLGWSRTMFKPKEVAKNPEAQRAIRSIVCSLLYRKTTEKLEKDSLSANKLRQAKDPKAELAKYVADIQHYLPTWISNASIFARIVPYREMKEVLFEGYWPEDPEAEIRGRLRNIRLDRYAEEAMRGAHQKGRRVDVLKLLRDFAAIRNADPKRPSTAKGLPLNSMQELLVCLERKDKAPGITIDGTCEIDNLYKILKELAKKRTDSASFGEMLKEYHAFGVNLLQPQTRARFDEIRASCEENMDVGELWELACCIAISSLRHEYRRCEQDETQMKTFLSGKYAQESADLDELLRNPTDSVPESLAKIFDIPRNEPSPAATSPRAEPKWTIGKLKAFRRKLFYFSPSTHPFAETNGAHALKRYSSIILNSVLIAVLLELWRANVLERDHDKGTDDDELNRRFESLDDPKAFLDWLDLFRTKAPANTDAGNAGELDEAWSQFKGILRSNFDAIPRRCAVNSIKWHEPLFTLIKAARKIETRPEPIWKSARELEQEIREGKLEFGPSLLVTTDHNMDKELRRHYETWLDGLLSRRRIEDDLAKTFREVVLDHFDRWMIVRRLEVHFMPASTLHMVARRCLERANRILKGKLLVPGQEGAWQTRFVVDGLGLMRATYSQVESDPIFLPALKFHMERTGVTSLVLSTQAGTPLSSGVDQFERAVADLFTTHIRTWRIFFYGEPRIAITTLPPSPKLVRAPIRQLTRTDDGVSVNRNFELFEGLERGAVKQVGLEVRFNGETQPQRAYFERLQNLLSEVFVGPALSSGGHSTRIVKFEDSQEWTERLRDFGKLKREDHAEDTVILQLDEYWSFQRAGALRGEQRYLQESCVKERHVENDPLEFFQTTKADHETDEIRRKDRFEWIGYFHETEDGHQDPLVSALDNNEVIDRIPFWWDFGFLLCDRDSWKEASAESLLIWNKAHSEKATVGEIWGRSRRIESGRRQHGEGIVCWREFAEAAVTVGARKSMRLGQHAPAFDLPIRGGESFSCLILEMWASEVYRKYEQTPGSKHLLPALFGRFTRRSWSRVETEGLIGLLAEPEGRSLKTLFARAMSEGTLPRLQRHSLELFKVTLLLREMLDLPDLVSGDDPWELHSRPSHPGAVSSRHWFSSACDVLGKTSGNLDSIPVRLPGHFSVRGDWYLGVAQGSQSYLLADRALDLLTSHRGNVERLQQGLGLPMRKATRDGGLRTPLFTVDDNGRRDWVRYGELQSLGALEAGEWKEKQDFHWLWRSALGDYDAQSRTFQRGLSWIMRWWHNMIPVRGTKWKSGFDLYDALERYERMRREWDLTKDEKLKAAMDETFRDYFDVRSLWEFPEMVDTIVNGLRRATPRKSNRES